MRQYLPDGRQGSAEDRATRNDPVHHFLERPAQGKHQLSIARDLLQISGSSSVGRASASQAEGRGFEPRLPLTFYTNKSQLISTSSITAPFFI